MGEMDQTEDITEFCYTTSDGPSRPASKEDRRFDVIIGALEDLLMDERFQAAQDDFIHNNVDIFEDTDENKLEYMNIFHEWVDMIERTVESYLSDAIDGFSMREFQSLLSGREDQVEGPVFDMFLALGEFTQFKETMIEHKREMSSDFTPFNFVTVTPLSPNNKFMLGH